MCSRILLKSDEGPFEKYNKAQNQSGDFRHIISGFAGNISDICLLRKAVHMLL